MHALWDHLANVALMMVTVYSVMVIYGAYELFVLSKIRTPMKVQIFQLFFKSDANGGLVPADDVLYSLAVKYAADYMTDPVDFTTYKNSWLACEVDGEGRPIRALGILGMVLRADFPLCRFTDKAAVIKLVERAAGYLHDVYGARGSEALVFINPDDPPEMRCPDREKWLEALEMVPANRFAFKIR